jgi:hypothetical protein
MKQMPPALQALSTDTLALIFTYVPSMAAWGSGLFLIAKVFHGKWPSLVIFCLPFLMCGTLILSMYVLHLCLPRLKKGVFRTEPSRTMISWLGHLALARAPDASGLKYFIHAFPLLKFLLYRAQGARMAYAMNSSLNVSFGDCPLLSIASGVTIGEGTTIACHTFQDGRLYLKPVVIENDVFISLDCAIGPGTTLGRGAVIGVGNKLHSVKVEAGRNLANFEWQHGPKREPLETDPHSNG